MWAETTTLPSDQEFIPICGGRDERAENGRIDMKIVGSIWPCLIERHSEYADHVAVRSIGKDDSKESLRGGVL
jgi:hypothetical protein